MDVTVYGKKGAADREIHVHPYKEEGKERFDSRQT